MKNSRSKGSVASFLLLLLSISFIIGGAAGVIDYNLEREEAARIEFEAQQMRDLEARVTLAEQTFREMEMRLSSNEENALGATNKIPDLRALFESSLASKITTTATSFTLVSATDKDGNTLASSTYAFIIDEGTANEEMVLADCTATACTNVVRGLSVLTGTSTVSSLRKNHGRGASVKITDGPILLIINRLLQGRDTFTNVLAYDTARVPTTTIDDYGGNFASVDLVNYVGSSGCADASVSARGCVEIATSLEAASSTPTGATGAVLALPASMATDTPTQTSFSASKVVISALDGFIKQAWIKLSDAFTWTGLHTFSAGYLSTASSTMTATTSIAASNVNSNAFIINALAYAFPSSRGAANTVLSENGSGTLSWSTVGSLVTASSTVAATTSQTTISNTTSETTYDSNGTVTMAAGKMGTAGTLRIEAYISDLDWVGSGTAANSFTIRFKLGGTTVCELSSANLVGNASNARGIATCEVHNINSASVQRTFGTLLTMNETGATSGSKADTSVGVAAIDTSTSKTVTMTVQWDAANSGNIMTIDGLTATVY